MSKDRQVYQELDTVENLLVRLCPDDPWSRSSEGLDDCCFFCGEWRHDYKISNEDRRSRYYHEPDCIWIETMKFLGRPISDGQDLHVPNTQHAADHPPRPHEPGPLDFVMQDYLAVIKKQLEIPLFWKIDP